MDCDKCCCETEFKDDRTFKLIINYFTPQNKLPSPPHANDSTP